MRIAPGIDHETRQSASRALLILTAIVVATTHLLAAQAMARPRVRATKGSVSSPPKPSYARARAEREWSAVRGGVVLPAAPVRRTPLRRVG
jgi:hypothetical protein